MRTADGDPLSDRMDGTKEDGEIEVHAHFSASTVKGHFFGSSVIIFS
jgi:hypothetical protein